MRSFAYLVYDVKQSGGNAVIFEHVNRLHSKGHSVSLISVTGGRPVWFKLNTPVFTLREAIFKRFDFVVCTFWPTVYVSKILRTSYRFYFVQGWEVDFYRNSLLKKLVAYTFRMVDDVVTSSFYLKRKIQHYTQKRITKIEYVEIDEQILYPLRPKKRKTKPNILSVISRYHYAKGPDLYDKAVQSLTRAGYRVSLVSFESAPPTHAPITFISNPSRRKLASLYRQADFLLTTSRNEGYYIPGLEAMASGCVFITTPCGGISEYAKHRYNAIIFSEQKLPKLPDLIAALWNNRVLYRKLQGNGLNTVKKYKWSRIIEQLERTYRLDR